MTTLLLFAPIFLVFEMWQLVICERYLGIKQIARGADPRALGLGELTAFLWTGALAIYWVWMVVLLFVPFARANALGLLIVTAIGFSLRRSSPLKWILVILTLEGAIRIGLLGAMTWQLFR